MAGRFSRFGQAEHIPATETRPLNDPGLPEIRLRTPSLQPPGAEGEKAATSPPARGAASWRRFDLKDIHYDGNKGMENAFQMRWFWRIGDVDLSTDVNVRPITARLTGSGSPRGGIPFRRVYEARLAAKNNSIEFVRRWTWRGMPVRSDTMRPRRLDAFREGIPVFVPTLRTPHCDSVKRLNPCLSRRGNFGEPV